MRAIADELCKKGHSISYKTVGSILHKQGYSLQSNSRTKEGKSHPDRDKQFRIINETVRIFLEKNDPVISFDAKKKEQVGAFKNPGQDWKKKGKSDKVNAYDFPSLGKGKAIPYGIYDTARNEGLVNIGTSYDSSEFAIESITRWWKIIDRNAYPNAKHLLICADGGGSNSSRSGLWKFYLQKMATKFGLNITVCHYPPATSKRR
jgi:hypothetical protein